VAKKRIVDGAYATMLSRISAQDAPALILLQYHCAADEIQLTWSVKRLVAIHPVFLTPTVVEPRRPLSPHARRAGWQGCNLRIDRIPPEGQISLVEDGIAVDPRSARLLYESSRRLLQIDPASRGWTALALNAVRRVGTSKFSLRDIYAQQHIFEEAFPNNRNIEAKIRQQLQVLRDLGYLRFLGSGQYEVAS
jgi:type II restriction enzyme